MSGASSAIWQNKLPWNLLDPVDGIRQLPYTDDVLGQCFEVIEGICTVIAGNDDIKPLPRDWDGHEYIELILGLWNQRLVSVDRLSVEAIMQIVPLRELGPRLERDEAAVVETYLRAEHLKCVLDMAIGKLAQPGGFTLEQAVRMIPVAKHRWTDLSSDMQVDFLFAITHRTSKTNALAFLDWALSLPDQDVGLVMRLKRRREELSSE